MDNVNLPVVLIGLAIGAWGVFILREAYSHWVDLKTIFIFQWVFGTMATLAGVVAFIGGLSGAIS